ncbi:hypothetical protein BU15DRAFT_65787 [Melanogaster broomeanus]|nr:hypothetical protein BU15DRAFT_65787 [Melanogaster broomeanus]
MLLRKLCTITIPQLSSVLGIVLAWQRGSWIEEPNGLTWWILRSRELLWPSTGKRNLGCPMQFLIIDLKPTSAGRGQDKNFDRPQVSLDPDNRDTIGTGRGKPRSHPDKAQPKDKGQSKRRSFDGIHRPNMTPMSIIPYPSPESNAPTGGNQQVQTPRMASGQGAFRFPRPSTPVTSPRGVKKGLVGFEESRYNDGNEDGIVFMGTGAGAESRVDTGGGVTGYMRVFSRPGRGETGTGTGVMGQQTSGFQIAAPIPGYAHAFSKGMGIQGHNKSDADGMYASPLRPLEAVPEEKGPEGLKRGIDREEMEGDGKSIEGDTQSQGSAKRMRRELVDNEEYIPLSSPQIPPTPVVHAAPLRDLADPSLTLDSLFGAIEQFVTIAEFEAECKLWTECTTEEWLKGADELIGGYTEMLNMVKDHLTEKVMAFSNLVNTVGERRAELNRDRETMHDGMVTAHDCGGSVRSRQAQRPDSMGLTQAQEQLTG